METTGKKRRRGLATACATTAMALACCPAAAMASQDAEDYAAHPGTTGTTEVTVQADPSAILKFKVPTVIPFYAAPDGVLTGPSAESCQIVNESVFGIHVTKAHVAAKGDWSMQQDATSGDAENSMDFQFGPSLQIDAAAAQQTADTADDAEFNMGYAGSSTDAIALKTAGDVARVTLDMSQAQSAATITWTVAPGFAK